MNIRSLHRRGEKLLLVSLALGGPLDNAFPDISGAVFVLHDQPVFVIELDIGSSHETHFFTFAEFGDVVKN